MDISFGGKDWENCTYNVMKEQLQANLFTKYLAGLCTNEEELFLKNWLKSNPSNQLFLGFVQQNIPQSVRVLNK